MSDDTPTQRYDVPPLADGDSVGQDAAEQQKKKTRGVIMALIVIGGLLLVALVVVLIVLVLGGKPIAAGTPTPTPSTSASQTPSVTPSATGSETPSPSASQPTAPPSASGPSLISFTTSDSTVMCDSRTGNPIPLHFRWAGTEGSAVYIAVGATNDPKGNGQGWTLPTVGTQADFPSELDYGCYNANVTYSLGIYDDAGHKSVMQVTVKNTGEVH